MTREEEIEMNVEKIMKDAQVAAATAHAGIMTVAGTHTDARSQYGVIATAIALQAAKLASANRLADSMSAMLNDGVSNNEGATANMEFIDMLLSLISDAAGFNVQRMDADGLTGFMAEQAGTDGKPD